MSTTAGQRSQGARMMQAPMKALGYQQLTGAGAQSLTVPDGAEIAMLVAETQNMRYRDDGVPPTATVGMLLTTTAPALEFFGNLKALQVIPATAGGILNVTYYG